MIIGMSTACFFSKEMTESAFEFINSAKIPVCEVFLSTLSEYEDGYIDELLKLQRNTRVFSVHALNSQYEPEMFNPAERTRKDCERIFLKVANCCKRLGAEAYIFHGPANLKKLPFTYDYQRIGTRMEEIRALMLEATDNKCEVCYENVHWAYFSRPDYFENLKKYTQISACLDIKQAMLSGHDIYAYVDCMADRLKNVHLCDFDDNGRLTRPGKGTFDFVRLFKTLMDRGYNGTAILEVYANNYADYDELVQSYDYLNECLYKAKNNGGI